MCTGTLTAVIYVPTHVWNLYKVDKFHSNPIWEHKMADVLVAVLQGRVLERAEGAAADMDPQAMLQEVTSTVIQETPFGTAGDKYSCFVLGVSEQV